MAKKKESGPKARHLQTPANGQDKRPDGSGSATGKQLAKGRYFVMTTQTEKLVYTIDETAKQLQISRNLCYRLCREHKIPGVIELGTRRMVVSVAAIHRLLAGGSDKVEG